MVRIYLDVKEIGNVLNNMEGLSKSIVNNVTADLWGNLRIESPVDHGRLQNSWSIFGEGNEKTIKSSANYAEYVNRGTGLYGPYRTPIVHPTIGKKFAFQVNGKMVYINVIKGIRPNPFVERSMNKTQQRIPELVIKSIYSLKGDS